MKNYIDATKKNREDKSTYFPLPFLSEKVANMAPNLAPKMEPRWFRNPFKNPSKNGCVLGSVFGWILMDFGREDGGKLAPKSIKN